MTAGDVTVAENKKDYFGSFYDPQDFRRGPPRIPALSYCSIFDNYLLLGLTPIDYNPNRHHHDLDQIQPSSWPRRSCHQLRHLPTCRRIPLRSVVQLRLSNRDRSSGGNDRWRSERSEHGRHNRHRRSSRSPHSEGEGQ